MCTVECSYDLEYQGYVTWGVKHKKVSILAAWDRTRRVWIIGPQIDGEEAYHLPALVPQTSSLRGEEALRAERRSRKLLHGTRG